MSTKKYVCAGCEKEIIGTHAFKIMETEDYLCAKPLHSYSKNSVSNSCQIKYLIKEQTAMHIKLIQIR